jgi:hypothetical protein
MTKMYDEIYNDVKSTLHSNNDKIIKFTELFINYIDNHHLNELHHSLKNNIIPSDELIKNIILDSEKNQKLFQWIEVLVREF